MTPIAVTLAADAIVQFIGADASREDAAAALELWRKRHGWMFYDADVPAVLALFDAEPWPASVHDPVLPAPSAPLPLRRGTRPVPDEIADDDRPGAERAA